MIDYLWLIKQFSSFFSLFILIFLTFFLTLIFLPKKLFSSILERVDCSASFKIPGKIFYLIFFFLLLIAFWLRIAKISRLVFYEDEFYHVSAAKSFLKTGKFYFWDYTKDKPSLKLYFRAPWFSWQVAQSFKILGESELSARLPALFWGVLFLPLVYFFILRLSKQPLVALIVLYLVVFDSTAIWLARYSRMYSFFHFALFLLFWLIISLLKEKKKEGRVAKGLICLSLFYIAYSLHNTAILLLPAFGLFLLFYSKKRKISKAAILFLLLPLFFFLKVSREILLFSQIFKKININYFFLIFKDNIFPIFTLLLFIIGALKIIIRDKQEKNPARIFFLLYIFSSLLILIYFSNWYFTRRYVMPVVFLSYWLIAEGVVFLISRLFVSLRIKNKNFKIFLAFLLVLFSGNKIALPSKTGSSLFTRKAMADILVLPGVTYTNEYKIFYDYLESQENSRVLAIHSPLYLYFAKDVDYVVTLKDLKFNPELQEQIESIFTLSNYTFSDDEKDFLLKKTVNMTGDFVEILDKAIKEHQIQWLVQDDAFIFSPEYREYLQTHFEKVIPEGEYLMSRKEKRAAIYKKI